MTSLLIGSAHALAPVSAWRWGLAVLPIVALVALVLFGRLRTSTNAVLTLTLAAVIGVAWFGAGPAVVAVGLGKGAWTGIWILYVVWPALLLYHLAARVGLTRMGAVFSSILPREIENVLIVAWIFPSFVQGVAGFGTPIAVAAPLLVSMGIPKVKAVALPLIGYHWSVTFGSMGSSFYMGALTAQVTGGAFDRYAENAALMLAVNMLLGGALVCLMYGGVPALRDGARMLLFVGPMMAAALWGAVNVEPSIGSLSAGAAGFAGIGLLRLISGSRSARTTATDTRSATGEPPPPHDAAEPAPPRRPVLVLAPYGFLLVAVLAVFLPTGSRSWVKTHLLIGPAFPETSTSFGLVNDAVDVYTPIPAFGHPGSYILLASAFGYLAYRAASMWPAGQLAPALGDWFRQSRKASLSVIALAALATVMVDTGMVRMIADGAADVTGGAFPLVSPLIGSVGSFTTGSTTSSNALFSALQRDVAVLIGVPPAGLLAAQTAGGNVGNSLAPVVMLIGATAVGIVERVGEIFRTVLLPAAVLLTAVALFSLALATI